MNANPRELKAGGGGEDSARTDQRKRREICNSVQVESQFAMLHKHSSVELELP
jgi:hypothetical protein